MNTLTSRIRKGLLVAALSGSVALTARAQDTWNHWDDDIFPKPLTQTLEYGITPFYGYRFGGEAQDAVTGQKYSFEDSAAFGLTLDYAPPDYYGRFELNWSHEDTSLDFEGNSGLRKFDLSVDVIQVGGLLEYGSDRFRPYVSAHIGATHFSFDGGGDTRFSFGIGGGVKAFLTKNLYVRADIRGYGTVVDAQGGFIFANGITVATFSGSMIWQGEATIGIGLRF
jgi:opacity protein-like surface antigen